MDIMLRFMRPGHKKRPADTENALVAGLITLMNTSIGATDSVFQHRSCTFGETKEQLKWMCQLVCGHPVLKDAWNEIDESGDQGVFRVGRLFLVSGAHVRTAIVRSIISIYKMRDAFFANVPPVAFLVVVAICRVRCPSTTDDSQRPYRVGDDVLGV